MSKPQIPRGKPEHKVIWKTVAVTLDGLVKAKRGDAIKLRKIDIEPALG